MHTDGGRGDDLPTPAVSSDGSARLRVRLDLSYDGTDFAGWAVQPGRRTVAGVLTDALTTLVRAPVRLVVAGRTDAGVHATGQVAHVDLAPEALAGLAPRIRPGSRLAAGAPPEPRDAGLTGLRRRLAGLLPADVRVRAVTVAPAGFDARFAAVRRHYEYRVATADWGVEPAERFRTLTHRRPLDVVAMDAAAQALIGLHDFAAYCRPRPGATTVRELQRLAVTGDGAAGMVLLQVSADAFCHSMVRALVGALLAVGDGRTAPEAPALLLADRRRTAAIHVAPAHGLTLVGVDYPPDAAMADRVARTRALRDALDPPLDHTGGIPAL
ncbi:tRNA pseudouridine(38-40) synthase TruA [Nakamurella leprariae]|uniref:tRNA pseudouridine synthase A n=1 Tax=Nakamurella leprariae TaxID=2803911 RepID=A0A939BWH6_9ACTN|nr:tRNA pseudouridine(38-40) synthase TruA [Nakamurella leprariae]MBM9467558.1 tRNA pseudouridine(38-40) synthase TruA [Nakamurella leprariae]